MQQQQRRTILQGNDIDPLAEYIKGFGSADGIHLARIAEQEAMRQDIKPSIGLEVGKFLSVLIHVIQAKRILELGTSLRYSTVWLEETVRVLQADRTPGHVTALVARIAGRVPAPVGGAPAQGSGGSNRPVNTLPR